MGRKISIVSDLLLSFVSPLLYRRMPGSLSTNPPKISRIPEGNSGPLSIGPLSNSLFSKTLKVLKNKSDPVVVSCALISHRADSFIQTAESIFSQEKQPDGFFVFVSNEEFGIDEGFEDMDPRLADLVDLGVNVIFCENIGPHRKLSPMVQILRSEGIEDAYLVTVDDDIRYPSYAIRTLLDSSKRNNAVTAFRGRFMRFDNHGWKDYSAFGIPTAYPHMLNLPVGRNGVCYKLRQLPDIGLLLQGPSVAPFADDLWFKMCAQTMGISSVILSPRSSFNPRLEKDFSQTSTAKSTLFDVMNSSGGNNESLKKISHFFELEFS